MEFQLTHSRERDLHSLNLQTILKKFQLAHSRERDVASGGIVQWYDGFQLTRSQERDVQLTYTDIVTSFDMVCADVFFLLGEPGVSVLPKPRHR